MFGASAAPTRTGRALFGFEEDDEAEVDGHPQLSVWVWEEGEAWAREAWDAGVPLLRFFAAGAELMVLGTWCFGSAVVPCNPN
jgi:hypothetical protein